MALPGSRAACRACRLSPPTNPLPAPILRPSFLATRAISTTPPRRDQPSQPAHNARAAEAGAGAQAGGAAAPRWMQTPERMRVPPQGSFARKERRAPWQVNEDPAKLDQMYARLLGRDGPRMLPEEIKWLAVTHKSFDLGRRGFNDRLAYFGRSIMVMEGAISIVHAPLHAGAVVPDEHGRTPFENDLLQRCDNLNVEQPKDLLSLERGLQLAVEVGLDKVVRWIPSMKTAGRPAGYRTVMNGALYAIVGAISLQHGAAVASRVARDKILRRVRESK